MAIILALTAAVAWGISDFYGGAVSKRHGPWVTAVAVQVGSFVATTVAALTIGGSPTGADWMWGSLAGIGVGAGTGFLYRGLSTGRMGVVAPVSAVGAALVPLVLALATGERPGLTAAGGIALALPAIWFIASIPDEAQTANATPSNGLLDGVLAGLGFGAAFACLAPVSAEAELLPLVAAQAVSVLPVIALAAWAGEAYWPASRHAWVGALLGPLGTGANVCLLLALQAGMLSIVAVLVSLYPAITVALAAVVLHERIHRVQGIGLGLAAVAVALISLA